MRVEALAARCAPAGLALVGAFETRPEHGAPEGIGALALLGLARDGWPAFTAAPEYADGAPDPLDRWSRRQLTMLGEALGAQPFFPFGGPPWQPFLRWGAALGTLWPSPLGMSIHAERGLWVSFRGALGFRRLDGIVTAGEAAPCESCASRPCLTACPVDAFSGDRYDVAACVAHLRNAEGAPCREAGCLARRACPVGRGWTPPPEQARFHMSAFLRARCES